MPPKLRESNKNYISIVSDRADEQGAADSLAKSDRLTTKYLRGLISAVFNRVAEARK